jgi:hypothetical protein
MRENAKICVKMNGCGNVKRVSISGLLSYPDRHQQVHIGSVQIPDNDVRNALLNWNHKNTEKK